MPTTRVVRRIIGRLVEEFEWQAPDLGGFTARVKDRLGDDATPKLIERTACIVHYADLYTAIQGGGQPREMALNELFEVRWHEGVDGAPDVHYRGYLFRSAYVLLRKRLQNTGRVISHDQLTELAVHAATAARLSTERNIHQVQAPENFWGWLAKVLAHEVSHEVERFNRVPDEDDLAEVERVRPGGEVTTEAVDLAIAVRDEVKRKARLRRLSEEQVYILFWNFWEGLSAEQIAARLTTQSGRPMTAAQVGHVKHAAVTVLRNNLRHSGLDV